MASGVASVLGVATSRVTVYAADASWCTDSSSCEGVEITVQVSATSYATASVVRRDVLDMMPTSAEWSSALGTDSGSTSIKSPPVVSSLSVSPIVHVAAVEPTAEEEGFPIMIIGAAAAAILLLVAFLCYRRQKRKAQKAKEEEPQQNRQHRQTQPQAAAVPRPEGAAPAPPASPSRISGRPSSPQKGGCYTRPGRR